MWECQCKCGRITIVKTCKLSSGKTKSCGCSHGEIGIYSPLAPGFGEIISKYIKRAEEKGRVWELTEEQAFVLFCGDCHYCGASPSYRVSRKGRAVKRIFPHNGIDRKDNTQGYTVENCVSCCGSCNRKKHQTLYEVFVSGQFTAQMGLLVCKSCKQELPPSDFYDSESATGKRSYCKKCMIQAATRSYQNRKRSKAL